MVIEPKPALCRLLEYDGDEATVEVNTGHMHLPRVAMPAATLRAEYLEPGMEFVWFITDPRPEPPPKITRDPSILALAKGRIELLEMQSEEDREEAKFRAVPDEVVQKGADLFKAFHLASDNRPMFDEKYFRTFAAMAALLEPYDLLKKYRDVLLDRMIVRGREACAERMRKLCAKQTSTPVYPTPDWAKSIQIPAIKNPPSPEAMAKSLVDLGLKPPSYTEQYKELSRWQRLKLRVRLVWAALTRELPPKTVTKEDELEAACRYTLAQEFDDICWLDFYTKIAKILGVEYDPKLLPRDRFLGNCGRFYDSMASGRPYERDPGKECCDGSDGTVPGGCGSQPRRPLPLRDGAEADR